MVDDYPKRGAIANIMVIDERPPIHTVVRCQYELFLAVFAVCVEHDMLLIN